MNTSLAMKARCLLSPVIVLMLAVVSVLLIAAATELRAESGHTKRATKVPAKLQVPDGNEFSFNASATGVQIYVWTVNPSNPALSNWFLKAPEATLTNAEGKSIGTHGKGPTWKSNDGSEVQGAKVAEEMESTNAIPWLLLRAVSSKGPGIFEHTTYIQRVNTEGGLAPSAAGTAGQIARVPYTAEYYFFRKVQK